MSVCLNINALVSMVDPDFLDKLDKIAQNIRGNSLVFGGIQVLNELNNIKGAGDR
jgi:hypothetical protein